MNGDANDGLGNKPGGASAAGSNSSYLRTGSTPAVYSSSPRLRRLEEMKKSYLSTGGLPNQSSTNTGYTTNSSGGSQTPPGYSTTSAATFGTKYRLASLDRLAHRQKLYETNGSAEPAPVNGNSNPNPTTNGINGNSTHGASTVTTTTSINLTNSSTVPVGKDVKDGNKSNNINNGLTSPTSAGPVQSALLQSKREMFFKAESTGGGSGGGGGGGGGGGVGVAAGAGGGTGGAPLVAPSSAPPAPPVSAPSNAPPPPPNSTTTTQAPTPITTTATTTTTTTVASIKEQLLTTKEKKEHKDEENKENKMVKEMVTKEQRPREVDGYVGFANLPNQVYRKAVKKGFEFSLMVVGESGLGKSTLINSMFLSDIYSNDHPGPSHRVKKTVQVETTKVLLKENGVNLMLTVVDTPGFGDAVDNSDCWQPVIDYIESKYEEYLNTESRVNRVYIADYRVHCCLYFIAPSGHGLKPLDIEFMRRLHDKVNIIPVIAKADTLTPDECQHLKKQVLNEIAQHKIKIYEFPDDDSGDAAALKLKQRIPYAVVGSNTVIEVDGKKLRGRKYPWGVVEVENMEHCDFIPLRNMMIRTHMQDLKDVTNNVHYENYRCRKLAGIGGVDGKIKSSNKNPLAQMEEEKKEHSNRMHKMEAEMEQVFEMKVKEKMNKLNELENDLQKRNESMRKKLEAELVELKEDRDHFEQEKKHWEHATGVTMEELRRKSLESSSREHVDLKEKPKKKKGGLFQTNN